jgi:flavin-dependent dehydrogenase
MIDVLVIGGGPAGSTAATLLARKGFSVTLLERERFPRFQIGESLLPYNNDLFARLGVDEQLLAGDYFPKYGAQFVTGDGSISTTFRFDRTLEDPYRRSFQVTRSEFDHLLLRNAAKNGVDVREETGVVATVLDDRSRAVVKTAAGESIEARFVIDASGHGAVIGNRIGEKNDIDALKKVAFFAHYRNVERVEGRDGGNTLIVVLRDAWFWLIPITAELMSVGLVVDRDHARNCGLAPEALLERTIAETPYVRDRMRDAERTTQVYARRDFSYSMQRMVGPNFALIGDAAGFIDPIFSTGVFMAMKSADLAADAVEQRLRGGSQRLLRRYETRMSRALGKYFRFISNFYRREFLEVFMQPQSEFGLQRAIIGVLAGDIFAERGYRLKLAAFFALVRLQGLFGRVAPRIAWEKMPGAATV